MDFPMTRVPKTRCCRLSSSVYTSRSSSIAFIISWFPSSVVWTSATDDVTSCTVVAGFSTMTSVFRIRVIRWCIVFSCLLATSVPLLLMVPPLCDLCCTSMSFVWNESVSPLLDTPLAVVPITEF